jgi:hypothetical protein
LIDTNNNLNDDELSNLTSDTYDYDEEEEEIEVIKFDFKGNIYLKSKTNFIYDLDSHDCIGIWNEKKELIEELGDDCD